MKELKRSATDCKICGVCGGLGEYFGIDSNLIRLIWAGVTLFTGVGALVYIAAAVIMPKADKDERDLKDVMQPQKDLKDVIHPENSDQNMDQ